MNLKYLLLAILINFNFIIPFSISEIKDTTLVVSEKPQYLLLDFNCDGNTDYVIASISDSVLLLKIYLMQGNDTLKTTGLLFGLGNPGRSSSFCGNIIKLKLENLDYDPKSFLDEEPPGFRRSKNCKGIVLSDGMCDSFHVYWNYDDGDISCWRL